ncbi:TPA: transporter [Candidatus Sumerlaeota bacterium]|jgi:solute:Na+ symporter, SSS family|nr:transporter [Candidatus Sumerlaeota bacterium]
MYIYGIHIIDFGIILFFLLGVLGVGWYAQKSVKGESDFFIGGRKFGKVLMFFLTFGNMTDSNGAANVSSEVYRQGAGGMWSGFQTLFITPFYWFSNIWFRRVRLITMADLFQDRFNSRSLALAYVLFNVVMAPLSLGLGNVASYKVASAMIVKPTSAYTAEEKAMVDAFQEYQQLKKEAVANHLSPEKKTRLEVLESMKKKDKLQSFVSYLSPIPFYIAYTVIVAIYIIMGGLRAAALTDALQGTLIILFTFIVIGVGLPQLGGFAGLHKAIPEHMFQIFGTVATSEYTWYAILAITFTSMVQIFGLMGNMAGTGSARDEDAARTGAIAGAFAKRVVIIGWMLCALIAVALYPNNGIADPDNAWGILSLRLLGPGFMGIMISGMLIGHMPAVGSTAVAISALATRNIYEPLVPGKSSKHYMLVGQLSIALILILGILVGLLSNKIIPLYYQIITLNAFFGAAVVLIFYWRRLAAGAIMVGLIIWVLLIGVAPYAVLGVKSLRQSPTLTAQTREQVIEAPSGAKQEDVDAGLAKKVGETITKSQVISPASIFFENVALSDPKNPQSPKEGVGRFNAEVFTLHLIGVPVEKLTKAGLVTARWTFDGVFPFVMLIFISYLFPKTEKSRVDVFHAKMKTQVRRDPREDEIEVALSLAQPGRFDHLKLFPRSNWEFTKWKLEDYIGFSVCWGIVLVIMSLLWLVLTIGS